MPVLCLVKDLLHLICESSGFYTFSPVFGSRAVVVVLVPQLLLLLLLLLRRLLAVLLAVVVESNIIVLMFLLLLFPQRPNPSLRTWCPHFHD